ncbi:BspA family leucine-rich repeat surface protein, partial [Limosilactobacillus fermentum]
MSAIASATAEAKAGANDAIIRAKSAWDVAVQSSQPAQNDLSVQGNQTNQTVPSSATAAADTSNSDSLDSNIYGTVNVKDWDYQNDSNTFNLTSYHGQDTRHIIVPNLNDFDNAGVKIRNATDVISSELARSLASRSLAFAISKTSGKYSNIVTAADNDWSRVFSNTGLINADVSNLDTRKITDMNALFDGSTRLKTVGNLSHWDTSNVTDMANMFFDYNGVIGDLSHWDTSNVTNMENMFENYNGVIGDLSHWNVSNVGNMSYMFAGYNGVIGDLSHWDTSNVTDMSSMFSFSSASVSGLNTWNTRHPTDMSYMFAASSLPYKIVASNERSVMTNQVTLKDNTGKFLAIIDTPTIYDSNKSVRSTIDGIVQAEIDKLNKLNHTSYETPKIISDGDDDYSIANATYVVNNERQSKTGLINYVDQDGKVVKTDQVSGKVGDQINVKLSLPDGYELANKDEQIPSSITVGEDGINTITIQVKKLPVVQTTDWQKNANNQWVYNGKTDQDLKGTQYVQLPTIPDTNVQGNTNWYFVKDGIAQSGVQQWAGTYYYFDPTTYLRVDNDYRQSQWGDWYMFGKDGRIATGLYKWDKNNQWYYFNPTTYLAVTNNYIQANDGHWYLFTADGTAASRVAKWAGTYYYFDPVTHLRVDNNYVQSQWGDWYLFGNDGRILSGVQQWAGTYYYFDPTTYLRVDDDYVTSQWGLKYMFGKDGRIATGLYKWDKNNQWYYFDPTTYLAVTNNYIQANDGHWYLFTADGTAASRVAKWAGTYYYFDPVTHLRVDNNYVQSQWGDWYLFGNDGRILSGVQQWAGTYYYFDPTTYLRVDDDYVTSQWGLKYMFGKDGRIATGLYKWDKNNQWYYFDPTTYLAVTNNYIQANDGHWYLFTADGTAASRVAKWAGTYYYFDPVTHLRVDNNYVQSQWGDWYMFGNDGRIITGRTLWYGNYYYFDPVTYLKVTNKWVDGNYYDEDGAQAISKLVTINNRLYYFDDQGKEISNQFRTIHGNTYYFGNDSAAVTGLQTIDGKIYKFSDYGYLLGNHYVKIENGKLNIYSLADNSLIKTVEAGPWENMAYSMDSNSINNIDGYISYTGWYRPYGTSQDGKTWNPTTVADWRPILMYVWPSKDAQVKFIQYFVNHGYENSNYGLTAGSVKDLSENTASIKLNEVAQNLRYVIEQHIVAAKSTSQLANDINNFITTIPELSKASELSVVNSYGYKPDNSGSVDDDQVIFVNNDSKNQKIGNTSYADSNYRLMNRTINNQNGDNNSDDSPELLVGNDIDNSNPVVQAENLNWEYFLLNYGKFMNYNPNGNFDGFRIDAADNINADVLDQAAQLINSIYNTKGNQANANDHLIYNEGYHSGAANMLDRKSNPELYMDSGYFYTLENVLGRASDRDDINNLITNSIVNRQNDVSENVATPNWSFVTNHDQRKNLINIGRKSR